VGDGGPATAAYIDNTEGIWMDGSCNLYISDIGNKRIRKVDGTTGIITTIAGTGINGFSGDGGPGTAAQINVPYGLYCSEVGNVYFADEVNKRIRRIDAGTGNISTFAGGGIMLGDGGQATNALIGIPRCVYGDSHGNIYIAGDARIRKVNTSGTISTIAGTGVIGLSGDGGPATNAQLAASVAGMAMDASGNLYIADRSNARVRKISNTGIITTVAGSVDGYSGDGGPATDAQLSGPISIFLDRSGNLVIGDNQNNVFRKLNLATGIITALAGLPTGSTAEGVSATLARIHPEFIYIDLDGNIYFSTFSNIIRKITNYIPGLAASGSNCTKTNAVPGIPAKSANIELYPSPATTQLHISLPNTTYTTITITNHLGHLMLRQAVNNKNIDIDVQRYPQGIYYVALSGSEGITVKKITKL
jgi:sugar lactone lactonase YvrE